MVKPTPRSYNIHEAKTHLSRLLAQAQLEALPILTADKLLRRYDIEVMLA